MHIIFSYNASVPFIVCLGRVYVCIYINIYIYMYIYIYIYIPRRPSQSDRLGAERFAILPMCAYAYAHAHSYAYAYAFAHAYGCACAYAYALIDLRKSVHPDFK